MRGKKIFSQIFSFLKKIPKEKTDSFLNILKNKCFLLCAIFLFSVVPVFTQDEQSFKIGVCRFVEESNNVESSADGIQSLLYETLKNIKEHELSNKEIENYYKQEKLEEIVAKKKELEELYVKRDEVIFTYKKADWVNELTVLDNKITEKKEAISILQKESEEFDIKKIQNLNTKIPVEFSTPEKSIFFEKSKGINEITAKKYSLDAFLYGYIEVINNYTYVEMRLWNNILKSDIVVWKTALEKKEIKKQLEPGIKLLKSALIGKEWAELSVKGPENSMIFVNNKFVGMEAINNIILSPGKTEVEVKKKGFQSFKKDIDLKNEENINIQAVLTMFETKEYIIQAFPAGSDVYLDSKWVGKSPLKVATDSEITSVEIKYEGYDNRVFFIDKDSNYYIKKELNKKSKNRDSFKEVQRMNFLNTFGAALLSIPVTAIAYSLSNQATSAYNWEYSINGAENIDELSRLIGINNRQYSIFVFSLGLNIFLVIDTIIQAVEYVEAVEYFSK